MRRLLTFAMTLGLVLALAVPLVASAAPAPCVPGVVVTTITDADTNNIVQVTTTTTCNADGTIDDISVTTEVLYYWVSNSRGQGHYVAAEDMPTGPTPWQRPCGPSRAWDRCCP